MRRFERILDNIPPAWEKMAPVPFADLLSYPARTGMAYEEPLLLIFLAAWCITRTSNSVSGEIGRGTMEIILSLPITRREVFWSHAFVTVAGVALIALACWLGTACGIHTSTVEQMNDPLAIRLPVLNWEIPIPRLPQEPQPIPMRQVANPWTFAPICFNYFAVGILLAGVGTLFSSWDRHRWRTIGLTAAFYVLSLVLEVLGQSIEACQFLQWFSIFSLYDPVKHVVYVTGSQAGDWSLLRGGPSDDIIACSAFGSGLILIGFGCVAFIIAARVFAKRDVPAPL